MLISNENLDLVFKGFKTIYTESFDATQSYKDTLAMTVSSNTSEEQYGWLGQFPDLREWVGDRQIKELAAHGFSIKNKKFESTVKVKRDDISDDKVGIYKPMVQEMGRVTKIHPDKQLFSLLSSGFSTTCFDGQNFFDTDHPYARTEMVTESVSNMQAGTESPWFLLDLSKAMKPMIWQEREKYEFQSITDPHDSRVFMTDDYVYGIRARVNCGFGLWQLAFGSKQELTAANYAAARQQMAAFAGDRGQKLGITPTHLVVPATLEARARTLLLSDQIEGSSNIWKGTADLIVTPWLS
ncbi:Mu-like prophage major head subunit gpT family protein [Rhizobium lemnae]|uniref:Mu-like prophage major head subunit gpT family protein n=1 Tax=Rhizobium lemnae TaxID=1214924 RepID=A0ABV8E6T5_9HYPH|nr:Mu-like prophage major head subunit gpT family protein [Rhizobium lemnae]MCJ8506611.1 Mu-like prophage major head subunit gpT family protein [Rhizobium lemnae]